MKLESADKLWSLNASKATISVSWNARDKTQQIPDDALDTCTKILRRCFSQNPDATLKRFGLVVNRAAATPNPPQVIIDRFCSTDVSGPNQPLRNSRAFELHNLKSYSLGRFKINSWVRCKTGHYNDDEKTRIVFFQQDLNTTPEDQEVTLREQDMPEFFNAVQEEARNILNIYFPD